MAKMVRGAGETYEQGLFDNLIKSSEEQIKKFNEMDKAISKITDDLTQLLNKADTKTVKGLNDIFDITDKLNKQTEKAVKQEKARDAFQKLNAQTKKQQLQAEQSLQRQRERGLKQMAKEKAAAEEKARDAFQKLNAQTKKQQLQAEQSLQRQRERGLKQMAKEKAAAEEAARPYRRLERALADARRKYQDLASAGLAETKQGREQLRVVNELRNRYESLQKAIGNNQFSVGRYAEGLKGLSMGFRSVIGLLAQFGVALNGTSLATSAIKTLKDFDEGAADMAKTLNITKEAARGLSKELLNIDTRTSIADLQKIAAIGGQLGISAKEIVEFTTATDKLNVALGDEFKGGAEEITSTLGGLRNVFSDIKSEKVDQDLLHIGNALNVLGAKGSATSPVMADFAGRIGGVGIPLGLTTDQVLGLSATLQELNVNAERGGTAITKVLQKMTVDSKAFADIAVGADGAKMSVKEFEELVNKDLYGAFNAVVKGAKKSGTSATELGRILDNLGLDGSGTSEVFLKLGSNTDLLQKRITEAGDALKGTDSILEEFNTKNNTLGANIDKLGKAWDDYILSADSATGATGKISGILAYMTKNLPQIVNAIIKLVAAFVSYRLVLVAVNVQQQLAIKGTKGFVKELFSLKGGADGAANGVKGMGGALKGIAWTAIIGLAIQLGTELYRIASGAAQAEEDLARMNKQLSKGAMAGQKSSSKILDQQTKSMSELDRQAKIRIANGEDEKKVNDELLQQKEKIIKKSNDEIKANIKNANTRKNSYIRSYLEIKELDRLFEGGQISAGEYDKKLTKIANTIGETAERLKDKSWTDLGFEGIANSSDLLPQLNAHIQGVNASLTEQYKALDQNTESFKDNSVEIVSNAASTEKSTKATKANSTAISDNNSELERRINLQNQSLSLDQQILNARLSAIGVDVGSFAGDELSKQRISATETGIVDTDVLESIIKEQFNLRKKAIQDQAKSDIADLENKFEDEYTLELQGLSRIRDERLNQENLTAAERQKILENYEKAVADLNARQVQMEAIKAKEILLINLKLKEDLGTLTKEESDELNRVNDELIVLQEEYYGKLNKAAQDAAAEEARIKKEAADKEKKRLEEIADFRDNLIKEGFKIEKENSDARIALIDKEIAASEKVADALREQANQGNAIASQSLAAQDNITNEKIRQKQREQKEQQYIEELRLLYEGTQQYLDKGDPLPVAGAKAFVQVKGLRAIFSTLKGFFKGTKGRLGDEDTPFAPGKDGHVVRVDSREGIMSGDKMDKLEAAGIKTTDEITDNALAFKRLMSGQIVPTVRSKSQSPDDKVVKSINELTNTIKNEKRFVFKIVKNAQSGVVESMTLDEIGPTKRIRTRHETRKK